MLFIKYNLKLGLCQTYWGIVTNYRANIYYLCAALDNIRQRVYNNVGTNRRKRSAAVMKIFVSGLVNVETDLKIRSFPVAYYPID